jgi:glycosyltransferase involved in cell wall biosynthesis
MPIPLSGFLFQINSKNWRPASLQQNNHVTHLQQHNMSALRKDSNPLVSVVIATYNGARFIRQQLESIIAQTYNNLEIIVVDDASTDATVTIVDDYTRQDDRIKLVTARENLGFLKNFERGVLASRGEYVALSDQDDIWLPEKIEIMMRERGDHGLVYCNSELIDENGNSLGIKLTDLKNLIDFDSPINYTVGGTASGHAMIVKRHIIIESLPWPPMVTHDYWIGFVATFTSPLKFVNQPLVKYRQHDANVVGITAGGAKATPKRKKTKLDRNWLIKERMRLMYEKCPSNLAEEKLFFHTLMISYEDFTLKNNFTRMAAFLKYRSKITAYKKRSELRRILFCLKMLVKIE